MQNYIIEYGKRLRKEVKIMNYQKIDNGFSEWIVFIHGIGGSTRTWNKQIEDFSKEYNLLLLDLPGHGESQTKQPKKIKISKINEDIKNILDENNIQKADFVGLSMGTIVIAKFAIQYPAYVKSLIFGGAALQVDGIYKVLMQIVQKTKRIIPYKVFYKTLSFVMLPKKNHQKSRHIFIRELLKMQKNTFLLWVDFLKETLNPDKLIEKLNQLKIKILFISGDEDKCFIKGTKNAVNSIKTAKLTLIKHCGHICTIEKYKTFNNLSLDFLHMIHQQKIEHVA